MKVKYRQSQIIEILLDQETYVTIASIAVELDLSSRTIRNELDKLKPKLEDLQVYIRTKAGSGIVLEASPSAKLALRLLLKDGLHIEDEYKGYSPKQRQQHILLRLINSPGPLRVSEFEKELYISRATAFNDLGIVEERFKKYKIKLIRQKNSGLEISGRERHIRTCMLDLLMSDPDYPLFSAILNGDHVKQEKLFPILALNSKFLSNYFQQIRLELSYTNLPISLQSAGALFLRIFISIQRYKVGRVVQLSDDLLNELAVNNYLNEIKKVIYPIEQHYQIQLPDYEYHYLQVFFLAIDGSYFVMPEERNYANTLLDSFIKDWSKALAVDLRQDIRLVKDVYCNLLPMLTRFVFGIQLENPFLLEIRKNYAALFPIVAQSLKVVEERYGFLSSDSEVSAFVLSLVSFLKRRSSLLKALVFCHADSALKSYLLDDLKSNFADLELEFEDHFYSLYKLDLSAYDLIISTTPIEIHADIPLLVVHPLMRSKDYARLWEELSTIRTSKLMKSNNFTIEMPKS